MTITSILSTHGFSKFRTKTNQFHQNLHTHKAHKILHGEQNLYKNVFNANQSVKLKGPHVHPLRQRIDY